MQWSGTGTERNGNGTEQKRPEGNGDGMVMTGNDAELYRSVTEPINGTGCAKMNKAVKGMKRYERKGYDDLKTYQCCSGMPQPRPLEGRGEE